MAQEMWDKAAESLGTSLEIKQILYGNESEQVKELLKIISEIEKKRQEQ